MTIEELKEDVAYHCKSVHPRDNTAQTRIAKILPELIAVLEAANAVEVRHIPFQGELVLGWDPLVDARDALSAKLGTITFG